MNSQLTPKSMVGVPMIEDSMADRESRLKRLITNLEKDPAAPRYLPSEASSDMVADDIVSILRTPLQDHLVMGQGHPRLQQPK